MSRKKAAETALSTTQKSYTTDSGQEITLTLENCREMVQGGGQVSDKELTQFLWLCSAQGLNPFIKDAYLIKYGNAPAQIITSKDAFMKRAHSRPEYDGMDAGVIVLNNGTSLYRDGSITFPGDTIIGGWAKVYRKDHEHPTSITVSFSEYSTGKSLWQSKPATMIRKVAIVQAMREAFPDTLQGLYTSDEMGADSAQLNAYEHSTPVYDPVAPATVQTKQAQPKRANNAATVPCVPVVEVVDDAPAEERNAHVIVPLPEQVQEFKQMLSDYSEVTGKDKGALWFELVSKYGDDIMQDATKIAMITSELLSEGAEHE